MTKNQSVMSKEMKWRLLLPGASEPRLKGLTLRTLEWVSRTAIRQREHNPEHCCHLQLLC